MSVKHAALLVAAAVLLFSCTSGGSGQGGILQLIEFVHAGKANLDRNTTLTFRFSAPVAPAQDLAERVSIKSLPGVGGEPFVRAVGTYIVSGDVVVFVPRYPERPDYTDAGLRPLANYSVFLKAGLDALVSAAGDKLARQQEFNFETSSYFTDPFPTEPPRTIRLSATDPVSGAVTDLSRLDPRPAEVAAMDSATLLANGRAIDPGAGGAPYATPWHIDLVVGEPLDPATVNTDNVELWEIRHDALQGPDSAPAGHFGNEVQFRVPIDVRVRQRLEAGALTVSVRVTPLLTLVDDARYRIIFFGNILGIDNRKQFIGENGLTGDGQTLVGGDPFFEPGGIGYTSDFVVFDRAGISTERTLEYEPPTDLIQPEDGETTLDAALINRAPYNAPENPSCAVGIIPVFGDGRDGDLSVGGGSTYVLDTGDQPNSGTGNPFAVTDLDPDDGYPNSGMPTAGARTFDRLQAAEYYLTNLTISSSSTLQVRGTNPVRFRVTGIVQINGVLDVSGVGGVPGGSGSTARIGGRGGPGGFGGGDAYAGLRACNVRNSCTSFDSYLNNCAQAKTGFPFSKKGEGPGRGNQGGEFYQYYYKPNGLQSGTDHVSGTGGGGGGHADPGFTGDDNLNAGGSPGTAGPACDSTYQTPNSSVIGVRGVGGPAYGVRLLDKGLIGGSGGGGGGSMHQPTYSGNQGSGGSGGGGGGGIEIICRGPILINGGVIDASGGGGGQGALVTTYTYYNYMQATGAGGAGSGGSISLISGDRIDLSAGRLDARGGMGGLPANAGTTTPCAACNGGGDGAPGFIFLMDQDGTIEGLGAESAPGDYDNHTYGTLTLRPFDADRFGAISATTELFSVRVADPTFLDLVPADITGVVGDGQRIRVFMSSARPLADDALQPDLTTETPLVLVATVTHSGVAPVVTLEPNAMQQLNPQGLSNRESFVRVHALFDYTNDVEAAAGPFALLDRIVIRTRFND